MAAELRLITTTRAEAQRLRDYLRSRLGNDVQLDVPRAGRHGDMLVYGVLDVAAADDEFELDRLPVFDERGQAMVEVRPGKWQREDE